MTDRAWDPSNADRSERLEKILEQVARRRAAGDEVSDQEVIDSNPGLMPELGQNLRALGAVDAAQVQAAIVRGTETANGSLDSLELSDEHARGDGAARAIPITAPRLPGYRITREIHRGGQGVVYQAIQQSTKRKVAVKLLLAGAYASRSARKRFEREIEIVGQLRHTNIINIFHAGVTDEGHQYCVMDYVRGTPLHQYVRAKKLSLKEMLRLFITVCDGVQHAHQKGVIHRDLKPANILVDTAGAPKVLDFGLAKQLVDPIESLVTMTGQIVGTLPYMSPEQAKGNPDEIDTRTDIYALGIILYELLTGRFPYPVEGQIVELLKHITETPPTPPTRTWQRDTGVRARAGRGLHLGQCPIDDDVQTIVMKALEKEPVRRYQSAGELAEDIRRYLGNRPIIARPANAVYQFRKFVARHRMLFAFLVTIFVLLCGVAISTSVLYRQAVLARRGAALEAETANQITDFLIGVFEVSDPAEAKGSQITAAEILAQGVTKIRRELKNQPAIRATMLNTIGNVYAKLALNETAIELLEESLLTRREIFGDESLEVAESLIHLAWVRLDETDVAETLARESLAIRQRLLDDRHPHVADSLNALGLILQQKGDSEVAESLYRQVLAIRRDSSRDDPQTAVALNNLGSLLRHKGEHEEAEELLREALDMTVRLAGRLHPATAQRHLNLGRVLFAKGELDEAETLIRESVSILRTVIGNEHSDLPFPLVALSRVLRAKGDPQAGATLLREALAIRRDRLGIDRWRTLATASELGECLAELEHFAEAERLLTNAFEKLAQHPNAPQAIVQGAKRRLDAFHKLRQTGSLPAREQRRISP
ncbi:MAG: serine/threonine protein kinase [Planctomycetes bacterium]|nr:serine/threonine protein kinase [Planctomycetota bacterium]